MPARQAGARSTSATTSRSNQSSAYSMLGERASLAGESELLHQGRNSGKAGALCVPPATPVRHNTICHTMTCTSCYRRLYGRGVKKPSCRTGAARGVPRHVGATVPVLDNTAGMKCRVGRRTGIPCLLGYHAV